MVSVPARGVQIDPNLPTSGVNLVLLGPFFVPFGAYTPLFPHAQQGMVDIVRDS